MNDDAKHQILMLSTYHEDEYAIRTIRAGASAYLTKNSPIDLLLSAIRPILGACGRAHMAGFIIMQARHYEHAVRIQEYIVFA
ncbi:response regulator receiver domain-containing protein [Nitrosospira sp. Nsp5]|nr:response regulator receiver domain-containing protein [Nitrosospira sp. Nsp5]